VSYITLPALVFEFDRKPGETPLQFDLKRIPLGRFAEPSEITAMVTMPCGVPGRYITGQTIHVNGGLYMNS